MKVHNECILLVIMYRSETWSLSKTQLQKMVTTQCKMEWIMMQLTLHDRKSASWIHSKTGVIDIIHQICTNKHWWPGHVSWQKDKRWTKCVAEWWPWDHKQLRGHPKRHWWDDLGEAIGPNWSNVAKDQPCWTISREGFLQQEWNKTLIMIMMLSAFCNFLHMLSCCLHLGSKSTLQCYWSKIVKHMALFIYRNPFMNM